MLEYGDASKTRKHLCPCQMLAGCCCLRANRGQEDGMRRDGNWEQRIPRVPPVWGTPVLLCMELVTQLRRVVIHDELMPPQCTRRGEVSMVGEWGTIPGTADQRSQAPAERYHQKPSSCHVLGRPTRVCVAGKESGSTEQSSGARACRLPGLAPRHGRSALAVAFWRVYRSKHAPKMGEGEQMQKVRRPRPGRSLLRELH